MVVKRKNFTKNLRNFIKKIKIFLIICFVIFAGLRVIFAISEQELAGKTEKELYETMVKYYKNFDDRNAAIVGTYIIKNLNNKNKNVFYVLIEIFIRNISAASDKQRIYNEILKYCDYIINNIDFYDAKAYYYKAWVYFQNGDYPSAEFNLKKSIQNNPNFIPSLQLLLDLYIKKSNFEEAIKISQKIIDKGYVDKETAKLIFKLYLNLDKLIEAKNFLNGFSSYLNDEESYYLISLFYYKSKDYNLALEYLNKSLSKYPDNLDYLKLKVKILYYLKKYDESYRIITDKFKDLKDDEILVIKKDIEAIKLRRNLTILVGAVIILLLVFLGFFYYREQVGRKAKMSIKNLKKLYQERVSMKSENLEILVSFAYEFFNEQLLNFDSRMVIYVSDPKKDNVFYCYFNNVSNDIPDVMYVFPKYVGWISDYANTPAHIMELQSNSLFYEWIGGKNLINLKKNRIMFLLPFVSKGLIQGILFIQAINDEEEEKIIQILRANKEAVIELAEEIASDMISTRFKEVALIDELTRLYNRRFMYQKLEEEIEKASKNNQKLSYILCDIDNFKKFNDTYGHQVGDEVLIAVAKVFKGAAREFFDWPFRYGGEEIGIILPNTSSDKAYEIAERIRNEVSSKKFENVPTVITISLGIATYPDHAKTIEELIKNADEALYFSKKSGKNRTTIYDPNLVKSLQPITEQKIEQKIQQNKDEKEAVHPTFKLPSFIFPLEQFEEYYMNIKSNYKHVIVTIESNINQDTEKLMMEIYHNLLLVESLGAKQKNDKIFIKVLFIERSEQDIQRFVSDISKKYGVKVNIESKV